MAFQFPSEYAGKTQPSLPSVGCRELCLAAQCSLSTSSETSCRAKLPLVCVLTQTGQISNKPGPSFSQFKRLHCILATQSNPIKTQTNRSSDKQRGRYCPKTQTRSSLGLVRPPTRTPSMHTTLTWENMRPPSARSHTTNVKSQARASLRNEERPRCCTMPEPPATSVTPKSRSCM